MKNYDLIYFMGDSWTFALGQAEDIDSTVNFQNRWTGLVSKHLGLHEVNKSKAGCGNFYIYKSVFEDVRDFIDQGLKPFVVVSYSDPNRKEFFITKYNNYCSLNGTDFDDEFHKIFVTEHHNWVIQNKETCLYVASIQNFLQNNNIDFVENFAFTEILQSNIINPKTILHSRLDHIANDDGRFVMPNGSPSQFGHANVLGNKRIADVVIAQIETLYGSTP